jgi:predicted transcriptional regulator
LLIDESRAAEGVTVSALIGSTVAGVMTREVTVTPRASSKSILNLIEGHRISGVPVVEDGVVVGLVSEADLLRKPQRYEGLSPGAYRWSASAVRHPQS